MEVYHPDDMEVEVICMYIEATEIYLVLLHSGSSKANHY